jgi:hypothetical protein
VGRPPPSELKALGLAQNSHGVRVDIGPRKIRYAVVGLGNIAQAAVLPAFAHATENSELVALVSSDEEKLTVHALAPRSAGGDGQRTVPDQVT